MGENVKERRLSRATGQVNHPELTTQCGLLLTLVPSGQASRLAESQRYSPAPCWRLPTRFHDPIHPRQDLKRLLSLAVLDGDDHILPAVASNRGVCQVSIVRTAFLDILNRRIRKRHDVRLLCCAVRDKAGFEQSNKKTKTRPCYFPGVPAQKKYSHPHIFTYLDFSIGPPVGERCSAATRCAAPHPNLTSPTCQCKRACWEAPRRLLT